MSDFLGRLRAAFSYSPETGLLTRAGRVVGCVNGSGYMLVRFEKTHRLHRLVWLYHYGEWPRYHIDHINGNRTDNRICNLRDVPQQLNNQNKVKAMRTNRSGHLGVMSPSSGRYRVQLTASGKRVHVGYFTTPEEAHQAYLKAKRTLHEGCTI